MKFTKQTLERALRTFIQAFIACVVVGISTIDFTAERAILKTALSGLLASSIAAGLSAVMNLEKPEQLGSSSLSFDNWVNKYLGKKTDYDGVYGVQCVDLIDCYIDECLGLTKGFWGNAKYWWTQRSSSDWLKKNFDFIVPDYKNGTLKKGDIGVRTGGKYGHIFVIKESSSNGTIKYYDENATGNGDAMTLRTRPYTSEYINGILRPKNRKNIETPPQIKPNQVYTLTNVRGIYNGAGATTGRKLVKNITENAKLNATSKKSTAHAYLKAGTKVTILQTKLISSGNLWAKIPSGWMCIWEYDNNKTFVKN